ncbi:MAG: RNA polymerase sigma factor [Planctomycetota bacterium]|nr:MAG: RNA polymerase sigma factor [Planctomycetota bacterium]
MAERNVSPNDNPEQAAMVIDDPVAGHETGPVLADDTSDDSVAGAVDIESLVERYHARVYRYAYWLCGCAAAAEDITQETFLRAMRGLHGLREERAAESWLLTITRHEFLRWKGKQRMVTVGDGLETEDSTADPAAALADAEWVRTGLNRLGDEFRIVILMYYFENLSYAEIADRLGIPMGTVMSRLNRGKQHLKNALLTESRPSPQQGDTPDMPTRRELP